MCVVSVLCRGRHSGNTCRASTETTCLFVCGILVHRRPFLPLAFHSIVWRHLGHHSQGQEALGHCTTLLVKVRSHKKNYEGGSQIDLNEVRKCSSSILLPHKSISSQWDFLKNLRVPKRRWCSVQCPILVVKYIVCNVSGVQRAIFAVCNVCSYF